MTLSSLKQLLYPSATLIFLLVLCYFFPATANSYIDKWSKFDESLGHGFLIFAIVIFEIFRLSRSFSYKKDKNRHYLLLVVILLSIFIEVSLFLDILIFQQFGLYFLWLTIICYILGFNYVKHISFPLLFLLFAVPFWEFSNTFFVDLTTQAVTFFLGFSDLTVFIYNNYIETPFGVIVVAEGCSGIRYFEIGFALAVYAVHGENISWRLKLLVIITGIALGIITNWIRVLGLIYIGYWSEMKSPLMTEHDNYGFVLFFIVISGVILLLNYLTKRYSFEKASPKLTQFKVLSINKMMLIKMAVVIAVLILMTLITAKKLSIALPVTIESPATNVLDSSKLLSSFGSFSETIESQDVANKKCHLITRTYNFVVPGDDVLPYKEVISSEYYSTIASTDKSIQINGEAIATKSLKLSARYKKDIAELYYWYQYADYKMTNKYIAKLFEISYLFDDKDKMSLKVIWCP